MELPRGCFLDADTGRSVPPAETPGRRVVRRERAGSNPPGQGPPRAATMFTSGALPILVAAVGSYLLGAGSLIITVLVFEIVERWLARSRR